ncbi:MAG: gamma-glutamylcyclotransferase family protein [Bacteroidota bacterium]
MKRTQYLFSYGSLQEEDVQKEVVLRKVSGKKDTVRGYRLSSKDVKQHYPIAEPTGLGSDTIVGVSLKVSYVELYWIDQYETPFYKRIPVVLKSGKKAWMYMENT